MRELAVVPWNLPLSTITRQRRAVAGEVLVAEWTTMSAPKRIGLQRNGDGTVLSTISGTPWAWATSATASMSSSCRLGLRAFGEHRARVRAHRGHETVGFRRIDEAGLDAEFPQVHREQADGSSVERTGATTWSPGCSKVIRTIASAAMPLATRARTPASRAATRSSSAATVGCSGANRRCRRSAG